MQLRIEAQGKYLQSVLEKAQETLGRQNLGIVGLEAAKVQLSELVSKVSSQCLNSAFSELKELQGFCPQQNQTNQPNDCSMDSSCLTSSERSQKEQEIQNGGLGMRPFNGHVFMEQRKETATTELPHLRNAELKWHDEVKKNTFLTPLGKNEERSTYAVESSSNNLSMTIGLERETQNGISMYPERVIREGNSDGHEFQHRNSNMTEKLKPVDERLPSYFAAARLDLNTEAATSCGKQLDLNRFSWN